ncbi:hypothetical protein ABZ613_07170 [Streptomyces collinus]|uniref:hypothetical protein n=1 Tax=Streptomyces collinus TaxID=42684 RepID=UPI0033D534A0
MQRNTFLVSVVGGAVALVAVGAVGTHLLAGTESTSELDRYSSVTVDGHRALSADIAAGRTAGRYHALPWVGKELTGVSCPTGLKAVAGAMRWIRGIVATRGELIKCEQCKQRRRGGVALWWPPAEQSPEVTAWPRYSPLGDHARMKPYERRIELARGQTERTPPR